MILILLTLFFFNNTFSVGEMEISKNKRKESQQNIAIENLEKKEIEFSDIFENDIIVDIDKLKETYKNKSKINDSENLDQEKVKQEYMNLLAQQLKMALEEENSTKIAYISNKITLANLEKIDSKNENRYLNDLKIAKKTWIINGIQALAILICIGGISALTKLI